MYLMHETAVPVSVADEAWYWPIHVLHSGGLYITKESSDPLWPDIGLEHSFITSLGSLLGDGALGCPKIPRPFFLILLRFGDTLLGDALLLC